MIQTGILQMVGKLPPEAFRLRKHANQPPLHRLSRASDEFRLGLYFAAAIGSGFAQRRAQHRLIQPQMLSDSRRPLGAQDAVRNFLHVRQKKIHRAQFSFSRRQIHLPRASNQVVHVRRRFLQQLEVSFRPHFADE